MAKKKAPTCALCGNPETPDDRLTWDHIIPKSLGGPNSNWNLQHAHNSCNSKRGNCFTPEQHATAMLRKEQFEKRGKS